MSDKKISQLPAASDTDVGSSASYEIPVVVNGTTKKVSNSQVLAPVRQELQSTDAKLTQLSSQVSELNSSFLGTYTYNGTLAVKGNYTKFTDNVNVKKDEEVVITVTLAAASEASVYIKCFDANETVKGYFSIAAGSLSGTMTITFSTDSYIYLSYQSAKQITLTATIKQKAYADVITELATSQNATKTEITTINDAVFGVKTYNYQLTRTGGSETLLLDGVNLSANVKYTFRFVAGEGTQSIYVWIKKSDGTNITYFSIAADSSLATYEYTPTDNVTVSVRYGIVSTTRNLTISIESSNSIVNKLDAISTEFYSLNVGDIDIDCLSQTQLANYLAENGSWTVNSVGKHIAISCSPKDVFIIKAKSAQYVNYAWLVDEQTTGSTSTLDGKRHQVASNTSEQVVAPYGAIALYIQTKSSGNADLSPQKLTKLGTLSMTKINQAESLRESYAALHDGSLLDIAYSESWGALPYNSIPHFKAAVDAGFRALKADMAITSDNKVVLWHDAYFILNSDGDIVNSHDTTAGTATNINTMTLSQVKALKFATQVSGTDVHPASLDDFLQFCKLHSATPYITLRGSSTIPTAIIDDALITLAKYGMTSTVVWNLYPFNAATTAYLMSRCPSAVTCYTLANATTAFSMADVLLAISNRCSYICIWNRSGQHRSQLTSSIRSLMNYHGIKLLALYSSSDTYQNAVDDIALGIVGWQNYGTRTATSDE